MSPQKFWMVWMNNTPPPTKRHPSYQLAFEEADRIARKTPGKKVYVLEAMDYRWVEQSPLTYHKL